MSYAVKHIQWNRKERKNKCQEQGDIELMALFVECMLLHTFIYTGYGSTLEHASSVVIDYNDGESGGRFIKSPRIDI